MIKIEDEALKRFPPSMAIEGYPGEGDQFVDDEWGYDQAQRSAFITGAVWARQATLREVADYVEKLDDTAVRDGVGWARRIRALIEETP